MKVTKLAQKGKIFESSSVELAAMHVVDQGRIGDAEAVTQRYLDIYEGEHHYGSMVMYISRGLGNSVLPVRINNYPEIVVLSIHK